VISIPPPPPKKTIHTLFAGGFNMIKYNVRKGHYPLYATYIK